MSYIDEFLKSIQDEQKEVISVQHIEDMCYVIRSNELDIYQESNKYVTLYKNEYEQNEIPEDFPNTFLKAKLYSCSVCCNVNRAYDFWVRIMNVLICFVQVKSYNEVIIYNDLNGKYSTINDILKEGDLLKWINGNG